MPKRWSKLQKEYYLLVADELNIQLHCSVYPMDSRWGSTDLPRYWITLDKEIIWDYPKQFIHRPHPERADSSWYPYTTDVSKISDLLREYIDTPKDELFSKVFTNDHWGLTNILKASDKRIGKRRFLKFIKKVKNQAAIKVICARLGLDISEY